MTNFTMHTIETAPEGSKEILEQTLKKNGMISNLYAEMAESPELLKAYTQLHNLITQTSFNKEELTVVWQTINVEQECHYCVPAHTLIANSMKVDPAITEALRNDTPLEDAKLQELKNFTLSVVRNRGNVDKKDVQAFFDVGYDNKQILEVILIVSQKVISNYVNHFAQTPLDGPFQPFNWSK